MQTKTFSVEVPAGLAGLNDAIVQLVTDIKTKQSLGKDLGDAVTLVEEAVAEFAEIKLEVASPEMLAIWGIVLAKQIYDALTPVTTTNPPVPDPNAAPVAPAADAQP